MIFRISRYGRWIPRSGRWIPRCGRRIPRFCRWILWLVGVMLLLDIPFWWGVYSAGMVLWLWLCRGVGMVFGYA